MPTAVDTYTIGAIDLGGTILVGARNIVENPSNTLFREPSSGRIFSGYSAVATIEPTITFETPECGLALDAMTNMVGLEITTTPVRVFYTKRNVVAESAGADHLVTTVAEGIVVLRTLAWNGQAEMWMLSLEIMGISLDGVTGPFAYSQAALPTLSVIPETFTGGKVTFNGSELTCWQNATLDFGVDAAHIFHQGFVDPIRAAARSARPTLTVTNLNPADRAVVGQVGTRLTDAELFLRRNETRDGNTPSRVPDSGAGNELHVRLDMVDGIIHPGATNAPETGEATQEFVMSFDENETTDAIVFNKDVLLTP